MVRLVKRETNALSKQNKNNFLSECRGGEIGRHATLRGWCLYWCKSSSLFHGTKKAALKAAFFRIQY